MKMHRLLAYAGTFSVVVSPFLFYISPQITPTTALSGFGLIVAAGIAYQAG